MKVHFTARGHPNILATHKSTIEITKAADLSLEGDCILGVEADFSLEQLQPLLRHKRIQVALEVEGMREIIHAKVNLHFRDTKEIVIRKTAFLSERTLGIQADKAAKDLSRAFVRKLKNPDAVLRVEVSADSVTLF
ncbi:DUF371 domain-containing protein [Candidatus Woesearchaeota archaeon]|nr:DUF371 domain-containing protein [Candidatus Woesearchaeota archaeon]